jgi:hypothetical protein
MRIPMSSKTGNLHTLGGSKCEINFIAAELYIGGLDSGFKLYSQRSL